MGEVFWYTLMDHTKGTFSSYYFRDSSHSEDICILSSTLFFVAASSLTLLYYSA